MRTAPQTRYAPSPDGAVAFQVLGDGPTDLLFIQNWASNIEVMWEEPALANYFERLASFSRVIVLTSAGRGRSATS